MSVDKELDIIYDSIDELLSAGKYTTIDMILRHWNHNDEPDFLVGILTITLAAKSQLPSRAILYNATVARLGEEVCRGL